MEIPDYYREEILDMKPELVPLFLSVLGLPAGSNERQRILADLERRGKIKLRAEIPVAGGLQFGDLPAELQVGILGRVSPTAREGTLVSRDIRELADVALMYNLRHDNSVDPTIGAPDRSEFFKIDPRGHGEYFSPEPGLWREIKASRLNLPSEREIERRQDKFKRLILEFSVLDTQDFLVYGTAETLGKFVAIASYDNLTFLPRAYILTLTPVGPDPEDFVTAHVYIRVDINELAEGASSFPAHISDKLIGERGIDGRSATTFILALGNENARVYVIPLNEDNMRKAEIILPSLREDVRVISNRKNSILGLLLPSSPL